MIHLRPYQRDIIDQARGLMARGTRNILVQAPTGSGKTLLTASMLRTAAERGMESWFCVHRRELVKQSDRAFEQVGVPHGILAAGFPCDLRHKVTICSVQTLVRRAARLRTPRLVIWDEAHHVAAAGWAKLHAALPDAFHIGLTATPERLDGTGLGRWFQAMVQGPSVASLIEQGFLSSYRLFAPGGISTAGLHTRMGDFAKGELAAAADRPTITGDAVRHYQRLAPGRRAVAFCVSVEHSQHVAASFNAAGIPAEHVDGETAAAERDAALARFAAGRTLVLTNCELFCEGFDVPAIEAAILLRPTQSLGLFLQQVGRALRPSPGKAEALILDHAGNCERHGLPDEDRTWTLEGREHRRGGQDAERVPVRICPKCFAAQRPGQATCRFCGATFTPSPREVKQQEGELVEVDRAAVQIQRRREVGMARSFDDLVALGRARNYKSPTMWAHHILAARGQRAGAAR